MAWLLTSSQTVKKPTSFRHSPIGPKLTWRAQNSPVRLIQQSEFIWFSAQRVAFMQCFPVLDFFAKKLGPARSRVFGGCMCLLSTVRFRLPSEHLFWVLRPELAFHRSAHLRCTTESVVSAARAAFPFPVARSH